MKRMIYDCLPEVMENCPVRAATNCKGFDTTGLSKGDASQILNRLFNGPEKGRRSA